MNLAGDAENPIERRFGLPKVRETVIEKLAAAYTNGDLDLDDYERRVTLAEEAGSIDELEAIIADFPAATRRNEQKAVSPVAEEGGRFYFTLLGDRKIYPQDLERNAASVLSIIGEVRIDLSQTTAPLGTAFVITVVSFIGETKITVPRGTRIVSQSINLIGELKNKTQKIPDGAERYTLYLHGFKLLGDIKVIEK